MSEEKAPSEEKKESTEISIDENRLMAALSYLGFLFLVPLLAGDKKDKYILFHLRQGIVLFITDVIVSFVAWIPLIGWALALLMLVTSIYGFIQALTGKKWKLPYIGQYAEKINI